MKASDQLPEEGPPETVDDDVAGAGEGAAREGARTHARRANRRDHRPGDGRDGERAPAAERSRPRTGAD